MRRGRTDLLAELEGPPLPPGCDDILQWAYELHGRCGAGMASVNPVSYSEIEAWARLTGRNPSPQEVAAIVSIDAALLFPNVDEDK